MQVHSRLARSNFHSLFSVFDFEKNELLFVFIIVNPFWPFFMSQRHHCSCINSFMRLPVLAFFVFIFVCCHRSSDRIFYWTSWDMQLHETVVWSKIYLSIQTMTNEKRASNTKNAWRTAEEIPWISRHVSVSENGHQRKMIRKWRNAKWTHTK